MSKVAAILQAIMVPGMSTVLLGILAALAAQYLQKIKDQRLRELLTALVQAAEQVYGAGAGSQKLAYVQQQAKAQGLGSVSAAHVEASVYNLGKG